jgi:hypothetical protein
MGEDIMVTKNHYSPYEKAAQAHLLMRFTVLAMNKTNTLKQTY